MSTRLLLTGYIVLVPLCVFSQSGTFSLGAKASGQGYATVALTDEWSVFNNPGGISEIKDVTSLFSYKNRFNLSALKEVSAGLILPLKSSSIGLTTYSFGDIHFRKQAAGLAYSSKVGIMNFGVKLSYFHFSIADHGSKGLVLFEIGGIARISKKIQFGMHIFNPNLAGTDVLENEESKPTLRVGSSYIPHKSLRLSMEVQKSLTIKTNYKIGMEYEVFPNFLARIGITSRPTQIHYGVGYHTKRLNVDYALSSHLVLGISHQIGVSYHFFKK
ncbi:hypothetical protein QQ008_14590 [Fulvivirgaceae bacterium BMA10]|uniref:PorV/PorQ family protein n=1 Tax=Splendidivirga corallicola TaxID=3051826 RepID=A0ABT8KR09_9BACT|nr:hypothetical protein [Fulvivirgaceae bacterium BMA10]